MKIAIDWIKRLVNRIIGHLIYLKYDLVEYFRKHCKIKIPRKFPAAPKCEDFDIGENYEEIPCGNEMTIEAYNTGDGWAFNWKCPNTNHDFREECMIEDWYPFLFGVWCNTQDLEKIGIEVN